MPVAHLKLSATWVHINDLNYLSLGKDQFFHNLSYYMIYENILDKIKMLWKCQLQHKNSIHFPTELVNKTTKCDLCISKFRAEFKSRFSDVRQNEIHMRMLSSPFSVDIESIPSNLQLEFADLQCKTVLNSGDGPGGEHSQHLEDFGILSLLIACHVC